MTFSVVKAGSEVQVSTADVLHDQPPAITILSDGGWVMTWTSRTEEGESAIVQRRFDAQGQAITSEIQVNVAAAISLDSAQVVALHDDPADPNDGGWIVVWEADHHIYQRRFDANGLALDVADVRVNASAFFGHSGPSVSAIAGGGWVVSWSYGTNIFQRQYNAQGQATTTDVRVNAAAVSGAGDPRVMALKDDPTDPNDGGWIVTWNNNGDLYQRRYDAQGQAVDSGDVQVAPTALSHSVTALADGGWVVVWNSFQGAGGIFQCRYNAQGQAVDSRAVLVSSPFANGHLSPAVSALADDPADPNDGGWIVTWTSFIGNESILFQRRFDSQGHAVDLAGVQVKVDPNNEESAVAALPNGSWVVTWTGASNGWNTYQRIYRPSDQNLLTGGTEFAMGTAGSEVLRVMPGVLDSTDELNGGAGSDTIKLEAAGALDLNAPKTFVGFEVVQGSSGSDSIIVGSWRLGGITHIDGGEGYDILDLKGGLFNLQGVTISNVEQIALNDRYVTSTIQVSNLETALLVTSVSDTTLVLQLTGGQVFTDAQRKALFSNGVDKIVDAGGTYTSQGGGAPVTIALDGKSVKELTASGVVVGTLSEVGGSAGGTAKFTLLDNAGGRFILDGAAIKVANGAALDHEQASSHMIKVRLEYNGVQTETSFSIAVTDVSPEEAIGTGLNDRFVAGVGADTLDGGDGKDILFGRSGVDKLSGGKGQDIFVFDTKPNAKANKDRLVDFSVKDDTIWLDNKVFTKLGKNGTETKPVQLSKDFFTVGSKAKDKNDYVVYDKAKGVLYYDADGSGNGKAIEIATLSKKLAMTYKDFFVI